MNRTKSSVMPWTTWDQGGGGRPEGIPRPGLQMVRAPRRAGRPRSLRRQRPAGSCPEMFLLTKDIHLIRWLCNEPGIFSSPIPSPISARRRTKPSSTKPRNGPRFQRTPRRRHRVVAGRPAGGRHRSRQNPPEMEDLKACVEKFALSCEKDVSQTLARCEFCPPPKSTCTCASAAASGNFIPC